jgi:hypothetical protein
MKGMLLTNRTAMRVPRVLAGLLFLGLVLPLSVHSAEPPAAELKTTAVAVFKNGIAFIVRQGDVTLDGGSGRISPIPSPTLGTLWIAPNDAGASLDEVVAYRYKVTGKRSLDSLAAVLSANAGRSVTVMYDQKEITGEIVGLRETEMPPGDQPPVPFPGASMGGGAYAGVASARIVPEYLLLKVDRRLVALRLSAISQASLPPDTVFEEEQQEERKALRFKLKGAGAHASLTMGSLEHGLGWTPSYMISLEDETTARVTMQAVLTDDAADLQDADVFFVVGVPNFAYAGTPSPMALQQTLLEFMQAAGRRDSGLKSSYSNAIMGQMPMSEMQKEGAFGSAMTVEDLSGAPEEDLFLYSRVGVTLARGERATYNVFAGSVKYAHLYDWEVQDQPRVDAFGNVIQRGDDGADGAGVSNIWHSIRLENSTSFPWTSAPAMVISGAHPVSQDTLPYTPKAATSNLKVTIATDLRSSHEEREVARQPTIERRRGYNYDLVTVEGTLKVKNFKSKDVRLAIGKTLRGDVEIASDEGKAVKLGEAIQADNPMSRLTWELTLKAGAERVITYRYKIWLRV